ncbi:MAG TPA: arginine--tRNA ligase [Gaiellaceae bacterium]|nr:arginine--tRNA ligase [Gaiellaceae bacterium]
MDPNVRPRPPADPVKELAARLAEATGAELELERPAEAEHGDYATNVALQLAGARRQPPREIAAEIAEAAAGLEVVERAEVAGPGFVNLFLRDEWFAGAVGAMIAISGGPRRQGAAPGPRERVQVEMVSANPTGPLTVASARNGAYGDAVARLFALTGHEVEREYYYNDSGAQMERFRASVEAVRRGEEPPEDGYRGAYIDDLAALKGDPVPLMLKEIEASLDRFRIHFDSFRRQSELEQRLPELLPRLDTYEKDGALWARSSAYGDDEDRVLLRSDDRTPTYRAADVAYLVDKLERGFNRAIYVLGADHHGTRNWYAAVARMLGYDPDRVEVLLYQLVHLTRGGEQTKMSKRRGDVVFLDEFVDEIGVDAARWYLVNRGPDQTIEIDVDLAAERSQKNPVYYVQYAHARIAGILRNRGDAANPGEAVISSVPSGPLAAEERELVKRLAELPGVVADALAKRGPQAVPAYAIRVADDFHRFYHEHRVLESEQQAFRLGLCVATRRVIATCLDLVGVEAPDRM